MSRTGFDYCSTGGVSRILLLELLRPPNRTWGIMIAKLEKWFTNYGHSIIVCGPCLTELVDFFWH